MEHSASTPEAAIKKLQSWQSITDFKDNPALTGGFYYIIEKHHYHPMRRFSATYIKGKDEALVKSRCELKGQYYHLKSEWY